MAKYTTRNEYTISTINESKAREDSWLKELDNQLQKQAVQPKRIDQSMFEQINNIMGNKSKHSSVEDAVKDMQRRSGFLDYFNKKATEENNDKKSIKGDLKNKKPKIILEHPNVEVTINNYCSHTKGEQDLPAILQKIKSIHQKEVSDKSLWDEEDLIKFVHSINEKNKQNNKNMDAPVKFTNNDKDVDPANNDAWQILMPAKNQ